MKKGVFLLFLILMSLCFFSCEKSPTTPEVPNYPVILSFTANPSTILEGDSTTLSWETSKATKVEIDNGIGQVALSGSKEVTLTETTTFTLTASNSDGSVTKTCKVEVEERHANVIMIEGPKFKKDQYTFSYFGKVKNIGNRKADFVKVYIYLNDSNEKLVDYKYSYVDKTDLEINETSTWTVTWFFENELLNKIDKSKTTYEIEWEEFDWMGKKIIRKTGKKGTFK